jgi:hypothetical protein
MDGLSFYRGAIGRQRPCEMMADMQKSPIPSILSALAVIDRLAPSIEDAAVPKAPKSVACRQPLDRNRSFR